MRGRLSGGDARALAGVLAWLVVLTILSWKAWGNPELDPGNDLTVADLVAHGELAYEDVRYFYGPAGLYALAGAFGVFGTSFTVAFAFGYLQTLAILGVFYALARHWLRPLYAGLATAALASIGFSGTLFNFVLPHTNAATFGLLFVLLQVLAVTRGRWVAAGLAGGATALTRPEFAGFAVAVAAGAALGTWRAATLRAALGVLVRQALPAVALAVVVLGAFAIPVGLHRLLFENLVPLDFLRVSGLRFQEGWAPFNFSSLVEVSLRGLVYGGLLAALALSIAEWRRRQGAARLLAPWPLAVALTGLAALDGILRVTGAFPGSLREVEEECTRLLIGMSWLPLAVAAAAVWALLRLRRGEESPLGGAWAADLALVAGALACAVRSYNAFTTDVYSTYYAALPLLVAAIGHQILADRWPAARPAPAVALAAIAASLTVHAYVGLYRDHGTTVRTARGSYAADDLAGPEIQRAVDFLRARTRPDETALVLPDDPGIHFMTELRPALYELTFLPGTLDSVSDERRAVARLRRERPRFVVIGARRFDQYGKPEIGVDFNRVLVDFVKRAYRPVATFGDYDHPPRNAEPARAFRIYELAGGPGGPA
jgi:hypothetical protein